MKRTLWSASLFLILAGCQLPQERLPAPLPEDGKLSVTYAELLTRARAQAKVANEAFYVDRWTDLEDAARGLEQTARFLTKAEDIPATHKEALPRVSRELSTDAQKLKEAAIAKDVKETTALMQRVNLAVREMRLAP
jgi:hypothetical protein